MKNIILILCIFLVFSCKTQKNNNQTPNKQTVLMASPAPIVIKERETVISVNPKEAPIGIVLGSSVEKVDKPINIKEETIKKIKKPNRIVYLQPKQRETDGTIFYNIPDTMKAYKTEIIKVRITKAKTIETLVDEMPDDEIKAMPIKTTTAMSVNIVDPTNNFEIGAVNSGNVQTIETDSTTYTEWQFSIKPLTSGVNTIRIIITTTDGVSIKEKIQETTIFITPNFSYDIVDFIKINWQWIIGILTPIFSAFFVWFKKKKKTKSI